MMHEKKIVACDSDFSLTINEVINVFNTSEEIIKEMVNEGIININLNSKTTRLSAKECAYIRIVTRLHHDLGVNTAGAAVILEILNI